MTNDEALVERIAKTICRGGGTGLCVGFCHSKRCADAIEQYGVTARAVLAAITPIIRTTDAARIKALEDAIASIDADYMTSTEHHPGYVLIPTEMFERLVALKEQPPC